MKVTEKIRNAIPEQYRDNAVIYWNKATGKFYTYLLLGVRYDPAKKRGRDIKRPLGSITLDGEFMFSKAFLKDQEIATLNAQLSGAGQERKPSKNVARKRIQTIGTVNKAVKSVKDPRQNTKVCFPLDAVLMTAVLASLGGYTDAVSIALYWRRFRDQLGFLIGNLPQEEISHDTVNRILRLVRPGSLLVLLDKLTKPLLRQYEVRFVHIDGQAVRASKNAEAINGRYFFNVYDSTSGIILSQKLIDRKENEITVAANVLAALDLRPGDIITADALNTQKKLVSVLCSKDADYCLALKDNHPKLHDEVRYLFNEEERPGLLSSVGDYDLDHGRIERRTYEILPGRRLSEQFRQEWPGLREGCIVRAITETEEKSGFGKKSREERYFISSLSVENPSLASLVGSAIRRHWRIENNLHWELDVQYNQDRIQATDENYLSNRTLLNKISLSILHLVGEKYRAKYGKRFSIKSLHQLCSTPAGALDTLGMALEPSALFENVKL